MDELGRLLERLQQRVLALVAHRLRRLDDEDALAAFEGPVGGGADHPLAHLLDQVLGAARHQPDEVGMRRGIEQGAAAGVVGVLGAAGEDLGGEGARGGPLAGALRPAEEVGVRGPGRQRRGQRDPRPRLVLGALSRTAVTAPSLPRCKDDVLIGSTASITRSWTSSTVPSASITTTRSLAMIAISS